VEGVGVWGNADIAIKNRPKQYSRNNVRVFMRNLHSCTRPLDFGEVYVA
jgi:hypothetical protein